MTSLFHRRVRGFRLIELAMFGLLLALVFGVYLAKTMAGREHQEIARLEAEIAAEQRRIRLLKAEVAHLEQPERLGRLSEAYLGLKPVTAEREAPPESLEELSLRRADPAAPLPGPATTVAVAPAPSAGQPITAKPSAAQPATAPTPAATTPLAPVDADEPVVEAAPVSPTPDR